jgi:hypothetical protein
MRRLLVLLATAQLASACGDECPDQFALADGTSLATRDNGDVVLVVDGRTISTSTRP